MLRTFRVPFLIVTEVCAVEESKRETWAWRAGMSVYCLGINAFFAAGGLQWLRRKYDVGLDERMGRFEGVSQGGVWVHAVRSRSEERRVGKECRSRWSPYH